MENIDEILVKHFAGETDSEEESFLKTWKAENVKEYEFLKTAWTNYNNTNTGINFNTQRAWENVYKRSVKTTPVISLHKTPTFKFSIAAALVLIFGLIAYLKFGINTLQSGNQLVFENQSPIAKDITLPDGSKVWMNQYSKISYTSDDMNRKLELWGEAFFDVKRDVSHPFIVACNQSSVSVLGTSFNIDTHENNTIVSVRSGLVKLYSDYASVLLNAGEKASSDQFKISEILKVDQNYLSWKTGEFIFKNTPLTEIISSLNTYYKNRFESKDVDCKITAHFNNNSIEEITQTISLICSCKVEHLGDKILFH